jgi:PAS domain-containing protein/CheY-like chemotaxis protein
MIVTIRQPLLVLDKDLRVAKANAAFIRTFQVTPEDTVGQLVYELGNQQWNIPGLRGLLQKVIPENGYVEDYKVAHSFPSIGRKVMLLNARQIKWEGKRPDLILLAISDITELEHARFELERQKDYSEKIIDSLREELLVLDWELRVKHANQPFLRNFPSEPRRDGGATHLRPRQPSMGYSKAPNPPRGDFAWKESFDDFEVHLIIAWHIQGIVEASVGAALNLLRDSAPTAAFLDVNLQGLTVLPVAQECQVRDIPFVLITGYGRLPLDEPLLNNAMRVRKPFNETDIAKVLSNIMGSGA